MKGQDDMLYETKSSGKKQWCTLGLAQLSYSFEAYHYSCHKWLLSICFGTFNLAVQFLSRLKSAPRLEHFMQLFSSLPFV